MGRVKSSYREANGKTEENDIPAMVDGQRSVERGDENQLEAIEKISETLDEPMEKFKKRGKRPFVLRPRLRHEPPEVEDIADSFLWYQCFDATQREVKNMGGQDFEWRTKWLDLTAEMWVLADYERWAWRPERKLKGDKIPHKRI